MPFRRSRSAGSDRFGLARFGLAPFGVARSRFARFAPVLAAACLLGMASGCSLFVMAGKMLFGDPQVECDFRRLTGVDLSTGEGKVVVTASVPDAVKQRAPGIDLDMSERIGRRLQARGVDLLSSDKVLTWLDDQGGSWRDVDEVAAAFDTDYIIHADIDSVTFYEDNSNELFRGRATGRIDAYEVQEEEGRRRARRVFGRELTMSYPEHRPKPAHHLSERMFREEFVDRICREISAMFLDHRLSERIY